MGSPEYFPADDKERKLRTEEDLKQEIANRFFKEKQKKTAEGSQDARDKLAGLLHELETVLGRSPEIVEKIGQASSPELSDMLEVRDILAKINAITDMPDIDRILPLQFRITQEKYLQALQDDAAREEALSMVKGGLRHLHAQLSPYAFVPVSPFLVGAKRASRSTEEVQETMIQIKNNLQS